MPTRTSIQGDNVARLGKLGGTLDRGQRGRRRSRVGVAAPGGDVELRGAGRTGQRDGGQPEEVGFWS